MANVDTVLRSVKDTSCLTLCQNLDTECMCETNPDEDIPTGSEVISGLPSESKLSRLVVEHIIALMDDVSAVHGYLSMAAACLSSLGKLVNPKTFCMVLCASIRPMIQLNIPERFLEPLRDTEVDMSRDARLKKLENELLPKGNTAALTREPDNGPTRLLCMVLWLKLSQLFMNRGMQREAEEIFRVKAKQLDKLLTGQKYYGETD